jgi:tetratricopeptide (TPR) repeat protein
VGEGVTVKCSECHHVFRVRRDESSVLPPRAPAREWKIRQPNGNIYLCRELTTLQRWIIEGKVSRDDEISLTGETWKRLGSIPELVGFFQVVEDAVKGRAYEAQRRSSERNLPSVSPPSLEFPSIEVSPPAPSFSPPLPARSSPPTPVRSPPDPAPSPPISLGPRIVEPRREPEYSLGTPRTSSPTDGKSPPRALRDTAPEISLVETVQRPPPSEPGAAAARAFFRQSSPNAPLPSDTFEETEVEPLARSSRAKWMTLIGAGVLSGAGAGYYFAFYEPEQRAAALAAFERIERERAQAQADETATAGASGSAIKGDAPTFATDLDAGSKALDAGGSSATDLAGAVRDDAGTAFDGGSPKTPSGPPPGKSYDFYMERADALREGEKPQSALKYYGKAADLEPERVEPVVGRGFALFDMGQMPQAEAAFERALVLNPRYGPAIMGLAETLRTQGKRERAIEYYQRYLEEHPAGSEANVAKNALERMRLP